MQHPAAGVVPESPQVAPQRRPGQLGCPPPRDVDDEVPVAPRFAELRRLVETMLIRRLGRERRIRAIEQQMDAAPKLNIGAVQGNMSIREMGDPDERPNILAKHQQK